MRYRPFIIGILLSLALVCLTLFLAYGSEDKYAPTLEGRYSVTANEIVNAINSQDYVKAAEIAAQLKTESGSAFREMDDSRNIKLWILCGACVFMIGCTVFYIWSTIIKPFHKLEKYTDMLSQGNFDTALDYERGNYFGKFTWAFDSMRREIIKARMSEKEAIDRNKTVLASLSHDLKTPVASISAYSEALVNGLYSNTEEMYSYIDIISRKCMEVTRLTNDMITHSIHELGELVMKPESFDIIALLNKTVKEYGVNNDITFDTLLTEAKVRADKNRIEQLFGNLLGNAVKYAGGKIDVTADRSKGSIEIKIRDHGKGISDEDMPFVFNKFYRGGNSSGIEGSGLGLYIVKYIAVQSGGDVSLRSCDPGLEVTVSLPEENSQSLKIS